MSNTFTWKTKFKSIIIVDGELFANEYKLNISLTPHTASLKEQTEYFDRLKNLFGIEHNIIQGANGILNGKVLRFKNEPVRHKTLDLIGDLALLGVPIKGHVTAARAGHASNVEFVKKLKKQYSKELNELWAGNNHE